MVFNFSSPPPWEQKFWYTQDRAMGNFEGKIYFVYILSIAKRQTVLPIKNKTVKKTSIDLSF